MTFAKLSVEFMQITVRVVILTSRRYKTSRISIVLGFSLYFPLIIKYVDIY
jgi:hypothetical protein